MTGTRVCVIGAGPSGMSALYQFGKLENAPDIVCFEKQNTWGGLWNYNWRTGLDEFGEHCHNGMYKELLTNAPKEANIELPDYTFEDHFGQPIPSYPPRAVIRDYIEGRWTKGSKADLKSLIRFNTIVRYVRYVDGEDTFAVTVENQKTGERTEEKFSHCIVASGIFNFPNTPTFPGIESFEGRILHSHDFRNGKEFKGQSVLIIGSSYSAEDIALHCLKHAAKQIVISWRSKPLNHKWPHGIEERPLVERLEKDLAYFSDGTNANVDSIIMCTGYESHYPFPEARLKIEPNTSLYPAGLYKGTLFTGAGNNKLFYIGAQIQLYTMTMFDSIATWVCRYITGLLADEPKSKEEMEADSKLWIERASGVSDARGVVDFQTAILDDLGKQSGYPKAVTNVTPILYDWIKHREEGIAEFRSHRFRSVHSNTLASEQLPFMKMTDFSVESVLSFK